MEGTNVFTFSTLTIFFIHNGEYTHGGNFSFTFLTLMCFLILTGECIHGGIKCIHVFNVDEYFYS